MKRYFQIILVFVLIIFSTKECSSAKILGVFMVAAKSHYSLGNSLLRGLAEAGHDVTMISPYEDRVPTIKGSYRSVVLTGFAERYEVIMKQASLFNQETTNDFTFFLKFQQLIYLEMERTLMHPNVHQLIHSNETFDIVIIEQLSTEAFKAFAHHFKAHLVLFSSIAADSKLNYVVGNPTMLSYTPQVDTTFSKSMSFYQRTFNTLLYLFEAAVIHWHWLPRQNELVNRYFPNAPSIFEYNYNVSLILVNSHESLQQPIPLVPNIIPIGGFHIKKPKKLPEDLQEFLDSAEEGVIYVSFGSSVKAVDLPIDKKNVLLSTFGSLKYKILWKWEDDDITDLPSNVKTSKWFPQMDILAHPNIKLFITHGGILSLTETVYNGVPILIVPIFGDQEMNAQNVVLDEYGLSISFHDKQFSKGKLLSLIQELLVNPKYKNNAKYRSSIFHDRPMGPLEKAVYWIEYVIRNNGASHLRVAGLKLPWYKHYLVDVGIFLISTVCFIFFLLIFSSKFFLILCIKKARSKSLKTNKRKYI